MFKDFDLSKMTQMLSQAQQKANEFEESLATKEFESRSGGGLISVKINGKSEILDICIDDSLLEDKDSLQILLISAINDAIGKFAPELAEWVTNWIDELEIKQKNS